MTFWAWVLVVVGAAWAFMIGLAAIGAGIPLLRDKIRKTRGQDHE